MNQPVVNLNQHVLQEYGEDAAMPNKRTIYLSYLDSVKYFRPEVEAANKSSLRTYVYHELLLGYMQYAKALGINAMYIWSCPPLAVRFKRVHERFLATCHSVF